MVVALSVPGTDSLLDQTLRVLHADNHTRSVVIGLPEDISSGEGQIDVGGIPGRDRSIEPELDLVDRCIITSAPAVGDQR